MVGQANLIGGHRHALHNIRNARHLHVHRARDGYDRRHTVGCFALAVREDARLIAEVRHLVGCDDYLTGHRSGGEAYGGHRHPYALKVLANLLGTMLLDSD